MRKIILVLLALACIMVFPSCNEENGPVCVASLYMYITGDEFSKLHGKELFISSEDVSSYTPLSKGTSQSTVSTDKIPLYKDKRFKKPSGYYLSMVFTFNPEAESDCLINFQCRILNESDEVLWTSGLGNNFAPDSIAIDTEAATVFFPFNNSYGMGSNNRGNITLAIHRNDVIFSTHEETVV